MENINVLNKETELENVELQENNNEELGYVKSELSVDTEPHDVKLGTNRGDYVDIFTEQIDVTKNTAQLKAINDTSIQQLNQLTSTCAHGKVLSDEEIAKIYTNFKALNKGEYDLVLGELDALFNSVGLELDLALLKADAEAEIVYKQSLLILIVQTYEMNKLLEDSQKQMAAITEQFNKDIDEILSESNLTDRLVELEKEIKGCEDPKRKKKLQDVYMGMYAAVDLRLIMSKIQNKGLDTIKKECKKNYKKAEEKARKILKNDKYNVFMNPTYLEKTLLTVFPENKDEIQLILYVIYKKINKRNTLDKVTATFVNYFILSVNKLVIDGFDREESDLYHNLKKIIEDIR